MRVDVVRPDELGDDQLELWRFFARQSSVDSPFLRPEYAIAVDAAGGGVRVGIVSDGGDVVGFLPFQRVRFGRGRPVAARLSDLQGGAFRPNANVDPVAVVRGCGLRSWSFDRIVGFDATEPHWTAAEDSPYLDLQNGYDAYRDERTASGSRTIKETERKQRKFEREIGPLEFAFHADDDPAFDQMVAWKTEQHERVGSQAVFRQPWVLDLARQLRRTATPEFAGVLSVLRCGDRVAAVHFGIRSENVLHWWFPTYDADLGKYSPGSILLLEVARAAADDGVERIDLGTGDERYKQSFKSGDLVVHGGSIDCGSLARIVSAAGRTARAVARHQRLGGGVSAAKNSVRRLQHWFQAASQQPGK